MERVILGVLLAMAGFAATPIPTQVFTATVDEQKQPCTTLPIVVSASAPSSSQLFDDEKEVLASIITFH